MTVSAMPARAISPVALSPRTRRRRVPDLEHYVYRDGQPIHQLQYLQVKVILKGERFTSARSLRAFRTFVAEAAARAGVDFDTNGSKKTPPRIREVLFLDTPDFLLYRNAFILRRRFTYEDGFLVGDPEIVFSTATRICRRPRRSTSGRTRRRLPGQVQGRGAAAETPDRRLPHALLAQHSVSVERCAPGQSTIDGDRAEVLPALQALETRANGRIELVNNAAVEDPHGHRPPRFRQGRQAKPNVSLWRTRGDLQQLVGEFAFQIKFQKRHQVHPKALTRCEQFFVHLQRLAKGWVALGTTKTGTVYRLQGGTPTSLDEPLQMLKRILTLNPLGVRIAVNVFVAGTLLWLILREFQQPQSDLGDRAR